MKNEIAVVRRKDLATPGAKEKHAVMEGSVKVNQATATTEKRRTAVKNARLSV